MLVAILLSPDAEALELAAPGDVFEEANRQIGRRVYEIVFIAEDGRPMACVSGLRFIADRTIHDPDVPIDTLIVTGSVDPSMPPSQPVIEWIRRRAPTTRRYGSICTGAFLLAAAGLIDGKRVTTHWRYAAALAAAFPSVIVEPDQIFVRDGEVFSSAGCSAGIDLTLSLVEEDFGREIALAVAQWLVVFLKRPGGQSQFSAQLAIQAATGSPIDGVQHWVRDNPRARISVRDMAKRAGMSERNFSRTFRKETGKTPADFVEAVRVDLARSMLEEGRVPLQRVASACGFVTTEAVRRAFVRQIGITPTEYRSRFRTTSPETPRAA